MYIVTTSNRTYQKLLFAFLAASLLMGALSHFFYQAYYLDAQQRQAQLLSVITERTELQTQWVNPQRLQESARTLIYAQLISDLKQTNHPAPEQGALQMLPLASQFLSDNRLFVPWLEAQLQRLDGSENVAHSALSTLRRKHFTVSNACLSIEKFRAGWQLVSLRYCG